MKEQKGNPYQVPVQLRPHAPRQTEEQQVTPRYRQSRTQRSADFEEDDAVYRTRPHTSAVRYDRPVAPRRETANLPPAKATKILEQRRFHRGHIVLFFGLAMLVMLLGWMAFTALSGWWITQQNDWAYGRPRTYQVDQVVGHHDNPAHPTHFIAENLNRRVVVIEFPGGDPTHAQVYIGPTLVGDGQDLTPVTLSFEDRNGDGKPDLNMHIADQVIVFLNDGKKFYSSTTAIAGGVVVMPLLPGK